MLFRILRFHHGSDFVLPSLLAFMSLNCLENQTVLGTIRLFDSLMFDILKNLKTVFTFRTAAFNLLKSTF